MLLRYSYTTQILRIKMRAAPAMNKIKRAANLRVCASCEWIYSGVSDCPKCGFAAYGAYYVYGNKAYRYKLTQRPWMQRRLAAYTWQLQLEVNQMTDDQKNRLLVETRDTSDRLNKLNAFMATDAFPSLPREDKDLLYSQQRAMSEYVQILGKRLERAGMTFTHCHTGQSTLGSEPAV